jgi:hypothetical protein
MQSYFGGGGGIGSGRRRTRMPLNFRTEDEIYSALTVTKSTKIATKPCECGTTVLHVHNESTQLLCMQPQAVVHCCCDVTCACTYKELAWHLFIFPAKNSNISNTLVSKMFGNQCFMFIPHASMLSFYPCIILVVSK